MSKNTIRFKRYKKFQFEVWLPSSRQYCIPTRLSQHVTIPAQPLGLRVESIETFSKYSSFKFQNDKNNFNFCPLDAEFQRPSPVPLGRCQKRVTGQEGTSVTGYPTPEAWHPWSNQNTVRIRLLTLRSCYPCMPRFKLKSLCREGYCNLTSAGLSYTSIAGS